MRRALATIVRPFVTRYFVGIVVAYPTPSGSTLRGSRSVEQHRDLRGNADDLPDVLGEVCGVRGDRAVREGTGLCARAVCPGGRRGAARPLDRPPAHHAGAPCTSSARPGRGGLGTQWCGASPSGVLHRCPEVRIGPPASPERRAGALSPCSRACRHGGSWSATRIPRPHVHDAPTSSPDAMPSCAFRPCMRSVTCGLSAADAAPSAGSTDLSSLPTPLSDRIQRRHAHDDTPARPGSPDVMRMTAPDPARDRRLHGPHAGGSDPRPVPCVRTTSPAHADPAPSCP